MNGRKFEAFLDEISSDCDCFTAENDMADEPPI